jgi:hypothetical protein
MSRLTWIVLIVVAAESAVWAQDSRAMPFNTIAAGEISGIKQPLTRVVRNREAWLSLWRRHAGGRAPAVDFSRHIVIAVFAGESEARKVTIAKVIREPRRIVVRYTVGGMRPLPDGPAMTASPFHIVRLARSPLHVGFQRTKTFPVVAPRP